MRETAAGRVGGCVPFCILVADQKRQYGEVLPSQRQHPRCTVALHTWIPHCTWVHLSVQI